MTMTRAASADEFITEEFRPLEEMIAEDIPLWGWSHIHTRCAGLSLFAQWTAKDDQTIDNEFIDHGQVHLMVAARLYRESFHEDGGGALDFTQRLANGLAATYADRAEAKIAANEDPLADPLIASDMAFCRALGSRTRAGSDEFAP